MIQLNLIKQRFGLLTVIEQTHSPKPEPSEKKSKWWKCKCDCGSSAVVSTRRLRSKNTSSCGCLNHRRGNKHPHWTGCGELMGSFFAMIKNNSQVRDHEFKITIEDAWEQFKGQDGKCALSGLPIDLPKSRYELDSIKTASLDRIDSSIGYTKENIQWVHKHINMMKRALVQSEFIELCKAVAQHADKAS